MFLNKFKKPMIFSLLFFTPFAYAKYKSIVIKMIPAAGQKATGVLILTQKGDTLVVEGKLAGLSAGEHGFHIHENAHCNDVTGGFINAGDHLNPTQMHHGSPYNGHLGDLGNITANSKGVANFKIDVKKFNINQDNTSSIIGRTIMVHAQKDDEKTDPAGKSGARILCGEIHR